MHMKSIMGKIQNKMYKETNGTLEKRFSKTSKKMDSHQKNRLLIQNNKNQCIIFCKIWITEA